MATSVTMVGPMEKVLVSPAPTLAPAVSKATDVAASVIKRTSPQAENVPNKDGLTPLHLAVLQNQPEIVSQLIIAGANVNAQDKDGRTPIYLAVLFHRIEIMKKLIAAGVNVNIHLIKDGLTPLHIAVMENDLEMVKILIAAKAHLNAQDKNGFAPVHCAYARRLFSICQTLFQEGAEWDLRTVSPSDESRLLASAWGIKGKATLNKQEINREGPSVRTPAPFAMSRALESYVGENPSPAIHDFSKIITALFMPEEFDLDDRVSKIKRGELVVVRAGYKEHAITLVFYNGYLAICNRGEGMPTLVFKIDRDQVTKELLHEVNKMALAKEKDADTFFYETLLMNLDAIDDEICRAFNAKRLQKPQKGGFCAYNSPEAALFTMIALERIFDPARKNDTTKTIQEAKAIYKDCTTFFRLHFLERYITLIKTNQITKEWVDWDLLKQIQERLNSKWHSERFESEFFKKMRDQVLSKLKDLVT